MPLLYLVVTGENHSLPALYKTDGQVGKINIVMFCLIVPALGLVFGILFA